MKLSVSQYVRQALLKLRVIGEREVASPKAIEDAMVELAFLFDTLNARNIAGLYSYISKVIELTAGEPNYIMGPGSIPQPLSRPTDITAINVAIASDVTYPLTRMSVHEYNQYSLKTTNQNIPSKYFYNPTFPDGNLFLYPAPADSSYQITVTYRTPFLVPESPGDQIELPPPFNQWVLLKLTEALASNYETQMAPSDYNILAQVEDAMIDNNPDAEPVEIISDLANNNAWSGFVTYIPNFGGGN